MRDGCEADPEADPEADADTYSDAATQVPGRSPWNATEVLLPGRVDRPDVQNGQSALGRGPRVGIERLLLGIRTADAVCG
jgi:hypothetical protein